MSSQNLKNHWDTETKQKTLFTYFLYNRLAISEGKNYIYFLGVLLEKNAIQNWTKVKDRQFREDKP